LTLQEVDTQPNVRLTLPARAENVALVRQVLAGMADALDVDAALSADMKIALTEACTNVVVHAYPGGEGPLEVTMTVVTDTLILSVRDRGIGFKPLPANPNKPVLGFGLALMASLSDGFGIQGGMSGTEVQMMFALNLDHLSAADDTFARTSQLVGGQPAPSTAIALSLAPGAPLTPVLGRLVSLLAARADFSIDRLSDAQLVSDTLATHAPQRAVDGFVRLSVTEDADGFDLHVGPLTAGGAAQLVADTALPGLPPMLERLTDLLVPQPVGGSDAGAEALRVRMTRSAPRPAS
jgi:anti-sigma regulatory factor (Ser/Thr protein kinase)